MSELDRMRQNMYNNAHSTKLRAAARARSKYTDGNALMHPIEYNTQVNGITQAQGAQLWLDDLANEAARYKTYMDGLGFSAPRRKFDPSSSRYSLTALRQKGFSDDEAFDIWRAQESIYDDAQGYYDSAMSPRRTTPKRVTFSSSKNPTKQAAEQRAFLAPAKKESAKFGAARVRFRDDNWVPKGNATEDDAYTGGYEGTGGGQGGQHDGYSDPGADWYME